MSRDSTAAIAAASVVIVVVSLGLFVLGGPGTQRLVQSDLRTVRMLAETAERIRVSWETGKTLPSDLERLPEAIKGAPGPHKPVTYRPKSGSEYELCTTFATDSREYPMRTGTDRWAHPKGDHCFEMDASQPVPQPPYYY